MEYFVGLAAIFFILSYGLQSRAVWMWYAGWILLYLFASYAGSYFIYAVYNSDTGMACLCLLGGLLIWVPAAAWWATHRHLFGAKPGKAIPRKSPTLPPPQSLG